MGMTFGFVVLHYLADSVTSACVERLLALELGPNDRRQVVIVENGSHNGSLERLQERFAQTDEVDVLTLSENLGFARGNNTGFERLCELCNPDLVVCLNNDLMIDDTGFAQAVAREYERAPYGVLGPDVFCPAGNQHQSPLYHGVYTPEQLAAELKRYEAENADFDAWWDAKVAAAESHAADGPMHVVSRVAARAWELAHHTPAQLARGAVRRVRARKQRLLTRMHLEQPSAPPLHEVPAEAVPLHGSCYVFGPSLFGRGYLFNPGTFLYFEEDILAYECLRDGITIRYEPSLHVTHLEDVSTTEALPEARERERLKHREKARSMQVLADEMRADLAREAHWDLAPASDVHAEPLCPAFAANSINGASFRESAVFTHYASDGTPVTFVALVLNADGLVGIARRRGSEGTWSMAQAGHLNATDAHNTVSLAVDGAGYVHVVWSSHNGRLTHLVSTEPLGLSFEKAPIKALPKGSITYPQLYRQPSGDLLLLCRDGRSGSGTLELCRYSCQDRAWQRPCGTVFDGLADGHDESPYWQACVDRLGRLHLSWTWRTSSDASSNHDIYYAVSADESCEGFVTSDGLALDLPLAPGEGELVRTVPIGSSLVNQTSMTIDAAGRPTIVTLWREESVFQYHLLQRRASGWVCLNTNLRTGDFVLTGRGTRRLPCARPQLLAHPTNAALLYLVLRDDEAEGRIELASLELGDDLVHVADRRPLTTCAVGAWEPNVDRACWEREHRLRLVANHELAWQDNRTPLPATSPAALLECDVTSSHHHPAKERP